MLELARQRAQRLGIEVDLRLGDAAALDFADRQFDTVVATHFLSVVADEQRVVSEIGRVLKPGGRLLVIDHVQSHIVLIRFMQQALDPIAARYAGWHMGRDIVGLLTSHGFLIDERHRSRLGMLDEIVSRRAGEAAVYASPSQVAWLSTAGADDVERPRSPQ
jgi:SAM-dependent methyltransferase